MSQWLSTSTTSPNTRPFIPCGVRKRDGTKRPGLYTADTLHPFFADLSIYGLGSKVALFHAHGGAVVMHEALSRHLCFLHLLAGFAAPPTPLSPSSSVWWNCDNSDSGISVQDYMRYRGLPSHLVLHPQRTTSQGAVQCEQGFEQLHVSCMCVHVLASYSN